MKAAPTSLPLGNPPDSLLPSVSIISPSPRRRPSPRDTAGSLVARRNVADLHLLMDRIGIKRPLLFDDGGDARRWRMAEDLGGIRSKPAAAGSAVICADGSQRRAPSIIAVWLRLMRTERDRPAGAGRSRCWPTLRYKAGAVLRRGSGGFSLSGRSAAGVLLFHLKEQTQTAPCC